MGKYAFPNLSKKQRQILDEIGCGNYDLAGVFPTPQAIKGLLEKGLLRKLSDERIGGDRFGAINIPQYEMPMGVHYQWSMWQSNEYDKEQENHDNTK